MGELVTPQTKDQGIMDAHFDVVLGAGSHANSSNDKPFIKAAKFEGKKAGYVFKNGIYGVGYYEDSHKKFESVGS